jgi:hypothetical protein
MRWFGGNVATSFDEVLRLGQMEETEVVAGRRLRQATDTMDFALQAHNELFIGAAKDISVEIARWRLPHRMAWTRRSLKCQCSSPHGYDVNANRQQGR